MTAHVAQAIIELQILVVVLILMNVKVKTCVMVHWLFVQTLMVGTRKYKYDYCLDSLHGVIPPLHNNHIMGCQSLVTKTVS